MAKLFEFQGKDLLRKSGIPVPEGFVIKSHEELEKVKEKLPFPVVVKIQTWSTGRNAIGGVRFADSYEELEKHVKEMLGLKVGNFSVEHLLIEKKLDIVQEYFAGFTIDSTQKKPMLVFSSKGGSGIEEIARKYPDSVVTRFIKIDEGIKSYELIPLIKKSGVDAKTAAKIAPVIENLYSAMRTNDARSIEINPLILDKSGKIIAADCHAVIDDYAVFRHPEMGIEIAREFDRPPTELEKIAYFVEKNDYRGTFYFFEMDKKEMKARNFLGFHGAGGGGSMMSMNAVPGLGYSIANFCDTSGNPPASKVYRAAKVILSQPGIKGYFASGSGVASQEQFHSARGFIKAFLEEGLDVPAVLRLGGNSEEIAIDLLKRFLKSLQVVVEGYGKNDSPDFCMERLDKLIKDNGEKVHFVTLMQDVDLSFHNYHFKTMTGSVYFNHSICKLCTDKVCITSCQVKILKEEKGLPVLSISEEDAKKGKCVECLACEQECMFIGKNAIKIDLPIEGLASYRKKNGGQ